MRQRALPLILLAAACTQGDLPLAPEAPAFAIEDGAHAGNAAFYFLPPLVPDPGADGTFDPAVDAEVEICALAGAACAEGVAHYTLTTGVGSEVVRVDAESQHYIVNWHTGDFDLDPATTYRIAVQAGTQILGFVDVDLVSSGNELKNVDTGEYIPLKDGRTLPIKFRIEEGALSSCEVITFEDAALEQAVRNHIGKPTGDITPTDVASLVTLRAQSQGIASLAGLECVPSVQNLYLQGNPIADLSPLASLENLFYLGFSDAPLSDLSPLSDRLTIQRFQCGRCPNLTDLTPLAGLTAMTQIDLYESSNIASLAGLEAMTELTWLRVLSSNITDITPLDALDKLVFLDIRLVDFDDLTPLAGATNLRYFLMGWNGVTDLSPMAGWLQLQEFRTGAIPGVTDLSVLAGLPQLSLIHMESMPNVTDISPLAGLTNLRRLALISTGVTDISPIAGRTSLEYLDVRHIGDITPVAGLTNLEVLRLAGPVTDLSPLSGLVNLEFLDLSHMYFTDLTPIQNLPNVWRLDLFRSYALSDIGPLVNMPALSWLNLRESQVSDTSPLAAIALLTYVDIRSNPVDCGTDTTLATLAAGGVTVLTDCF